jgi:hypothetical protein
MITNASAARFDGLFTSSERSIHIAGIRSQMATQSLHVFGSTKEVGTPGKIRTCDLLLRRQESPVMGYSFSRTYFSPKAKNAPEIGGV